MKKLSQHAEKVAQNNAANAANHPKQNQNKDGADPTPTYDLEYGDELQEISCDEAKSPVTPISGNQSQLSTIRKQKKAAKLAQLQQNTKVDYVDQLVQSSGIKAPLSKTKQPPAGDIYKQYESIENSSNCTNVLQRTNLGKLI